MKPIRIIYMGTPEFAVDGLSVLIDSIYDVVGVVTVPDKPAGRRQKIIQSPVKKMALAHNIPVLQPKNLKSDDFLNCLEVLSPDLAVVVAFRMLPKKVWHLPPLGTFNLHASLLPDYRGAAPIHWAIINGEIKTGVTTFFIDEQIDTGQIILQDEVMISDDDTMGTLHNKLKKLGSSIILKTVNQIAEDSLKPTGQSESTKKAPKIFKQDCQINWCNKLDNIYNFIRGLNPFPSAWTNLKNGDKTLTIKIYDVKKLEVNHQLEYGTLQHSKRSIQVAVNGGFIDIKKIQLPNKRPLDVEALLNGFQIKEGSKFIYRN